jgi:hypothetical protein
VSDSGVTGEDRQVGVPPANVAVGCVRLGGGWRRVGRAWRHSGTGARGLRVTLANLDCGVEREAIEGNRAPVHQERRGGGTRGKQRVGLERRGLGQGRFVIKRCVLVTAGRFDVVGHRISISRSPAAIVRAGRLVYAEVADRGTNEPEQIRLLLSGPQLARGFHQSFRSEQVSTTGEAISNRFQRQYSKTTSSDELIDRQSSFMSRR